MKNQIIEIAGVPVNIDKVARNLFNYIVYELGNLDSDKKLQSGSHLTFGDYGQIKQLGDLPPGFKMPPVKIYYNRIQQLPTTRYTIASLAHQFAIQYDKSRKAIISQQGTDELQIQIAGGREYIAIHTLISMLNNKPIDIKYSLAHELSHMFVNQKKETRNIKDYMEYAANPLEESPNVFRNFFYAIYLTSPDEMHVRNSEIFTAAMEKGVTKETFREFLSTSRTYKQIRSLLNFTSERFLVRPVRLRIKAESRRAGVDLSEQEIEKYTQDAIKKAFDIIMTSNEDLIAGMLDMSPEFLRFIEMEKSLKSIIKDYVKGKNTVDKWLKTTEKEIRLRAVKTIQRIGKLYSILPSEEEKNAELNPEKKASMSETILDLSAFSLLKKKNTDKNIFTLF